MKIETAESNLSNQIRTTIYATTTFSTTINASKNNPNYQILYSRPNHHDHHNHQIPRNRHNKSFLRSNVMQTINPKSF